MKESQQIQRKFLSSQTSLFQSASYLQTRLHKKNISLHNVRKAEGTEILGSHVKNVILDIAQAIYNREQANIRRNARHFSAGNSPGIFDLPRQDRNIQDTRRYQP